MGPLAPAPPPSVDGRWTYAARDLSGSVFGAPLTCDYDFEMVLAAVGATFDGLYSQGALVCHFLSQSNLVSLGGGDILAGTMSGDQVSFDIDAASAHNQGTLDGDRMSGEVEIELVIQFNEQIDTIRVTGGWSAAR